MKKSIYNIDYIASDGKYYIMNTSSGNVVSVNIDQKCVINKILENPETCNNECLLEELFQWDLLFLNKQMNFRLLLGKEL